jgi:hypothetical protein
MNAPRQDAKAVESSDCELDCAVGEIDGNFMRVCRTSPQIGRTAAR